MGGNAVRLEQGKAERATVYSDDPVGLAVSFAKTGAELIHVVDLDGAFAGRPTQTQLVASMAKAAHEAGAKVQTGGGVRDAASVDALIEAGADLVVIGTLAVREPETARAICAAHPKKIVVAADAREGMVAVDGWTESSSQTVRALAEAAEAWGAAAILYTDVARDGMQGGVALDSTAALQRELSIPVYASGGVGTLRDLAGCKHAGIRGVIVGRALYEGAFTLEEALEQC